MKSNNLNFSILIKNYYYLLLILILILILILLYSCTSNYNSNSLINYKLVSLDTSSFLKVNLFTFLSQDDDKYYVISEKNKFNFFTDKFIVNRKYKICLVKSDSIIVSKLNFVPTRQETIIIDDGKGIWRNDTFVVDIYQSKNIKNIYYIK